MTKKKEGVKEVKVDVSKLTKSASGNFTVNCKELIQKPIKDKNTTSPKSSPVVNKPVIKAIKEVKSVTKISQPISDVKAVKQAIIKPKSVPQKVVEKVVEVISPKKPVRGIPKVQVGKKPVVLVSSNKFQDVLEKRMGSELNVSE